MCSILKYRKSNKLWLWDYILPSKLLRLWDSMLLDQEKSGIFTTVDKGTSVSLCKRIKLPAFIQCHNYNWLVALYERESHSKKSVDFRTPIRCVQCLKLTHCVSPVNKIYTLFWRDIRTGTSAYVIVASYTRVICPICLPSPHDGMRYNLWNSIVGWQKLRYDYVY